MNIIFGIIVCYLVEGDDSLDSSEYSACLLIFGIMVCYIIEGDDSLDSSEYSACLLLEEKSSIWVNVSWN